MSVLVGRLSAKKGMTGTLVPVGALEGSLTTKEPASDENRLTGTISAEEGMVGTLSPVGFVSGSLTVGNRSPYEQYDGEYEITPSTEEQILETADRTMMRNVVVKPIPKNYGLITWDGSVLTVS